MSKIQEDIGEFFYIIIECIIYGSIIGMMLYGFKILLGWWI